MIRWKHIALFLVAALVTAFFAFPYETAIRYGLNSYSRDTRTPMSYESISAGPFSATITELKVGGIPLGEVSVEYSPLSLLTQSALVRIASPLTMAALDISGDDFTLQGTLSLDEFGKVMDYRVKGDATIRASYNLATGAGKADVMTEKMRGKNDVMDYDTTTGVAKITMTERTMAIDSYTTQGTTQFNLRGRAIISAGDIGNSALTIAGDVVNGSAKTKFRVMGNMKNPRVSNR